MTGAISRTVRSILEARNVVALTGAGMSTESSIPDYRGPKGVWTLNPEAEKKAYRAYETFVDDPERYWREGLGDHVLLGSFKNAIPNAGHESLVRMEENGLLGMTITQNIDGLHKRAGSKRLIEFHGNAQMLRCLACNTRYEVEEYGGTVFSSAPPRCKKCGCILKSDVVNFGEPIPPDIMEQSVKEVERCDLMIICGTSATVHPFAALPYMLRSTKGHDAKIIEINLVSTPLTEDNIPDIIIHGKTGQILSMMAEQLKI